MATPYAIARSDLEYHERVEHGDTVVYVRDPVRNLYFKYNAVQAALLRALDGRAYDEIVEELSEEYEIEIPTTVAEEFVASARERMLLDITSYQTTTERSRKLVQRELRRHGFRFREPRVASGPVRRVVTAETVLFMEAIRELERGEPVKAAHHLSEVLEQNPKNERARTLITLIQRAHAKSAGTMADHPIWVLFDPTRFLRMFDRLVGPLLFSPLGVLGLAMLVIVATSSIVSTDMFGIGDMSFTTFDVLVTVVMVLLQGAVHELGHGYVCFHYGGDVREVGFMLMYYVQPAFYCDTSSTYLFQNRRHKLMVQFAGPLASVICSACMALILTVVNPNIAIYRGFALSLPIGIGLWFLNFVPFIKFDGYYALCDVLRETNLRERSMRYFYGSLSSRVLGIDVEEEPLSGRQRLGFFLFALTSILFTAWFIYVWYLRLITWMAEHWQLTGLVLGLVLTYFLRLRQILHSIGRALVMIARERRRIFTPLRTVALVSILAVVVAPWLLIRRPVHFDAEFALVPSRRADVRTRAAGLVDDIFVREGDFVTAGQPVARIRNDELNARIIAAVHDLEVADAAVTELRAGARPEEIALAKTRLAVAAAARSEVDEKLLVATTLASAGLGTKTEAAVIARNAVAASGQMDLLSAQLRLVEAGSTSEQIAAAEAARNRVLADLDGLRTEADLLTIRSPIDGTVVTKHVEEKLRMPLGVGDALLEVHDTRELVAEVALPTWIPMEEIDVGDPVALRPYGMPHVEADATFDHLRDSAGADAGKSSGARTGELVLLTSRFELADARTGMTGKARIYGKTHSLGYELLYLPVRRLFSIRLFSL